MPNTSALTKALVAASVLSTGVLVAACSGTTTGTGTSGGTSGSADGGGVDSSGATSSGSVPPGTGDGGAGGCAAATDDTACTTCMKGSCCSELNACATNQVCVAFADCVGKCANNTCYAACYDAAASAQTMIDALLTCSDKSCTAPCGG